MPVFSANLFGLFSNDFQNMEHSPAPLELHTIVPSLLIQINKAWSSNKLQNQGFCAMQSTQKDGEKAFYLKESHGKIFTGPLPNATKRDYLENRILCANKIIFSRATFFVCIWKYILILNKLCYYIHTQVGNILTYHITYITFALQNFIFFT